MRATPGRLRDGLAHQGNGSDPALARSRTSVVGVLKMDRKHYESELGGPIPEDLARRIAADCDLAHFSHQLGKAEAYHEISTLLLENAKLAETGLLSTHETLRILAAVCDAVAYQLENEDE
jgi:hypothetical protein